MHLSNSPSISPLLGCSDRETMNNVYDVLAFVSRAAEVRVESGTSNCRQDEFSNDEMNGLALICQLLMQALAYEPVPKAGFG